MTRDEKIAHLVLLGCYPIKTGNGYCWVVKPGDLQLPNETPGDWEELSDYRIDIACADVGVCDDP